MIERDDFAIVKQVKLLGNDMLQKLEQIKTKFPHIIKDVRFVRL